MFYSIVKTWNACIVHMIIEVCTTKDFEKPCISLQNLDQKHLYEPFIVYTVVTLLGICCRFYNNLLPVVVPVHYSEFYSAFYHTSMFFHTKYLEYLGTASRILQRQFQHSSQEGDGGVSKSCMYNT